MASEPDRFSAKFGPEMSKRMLRWWISKAVFMGLSVVCGLNVRAQPTVPLHLFLGLPQVFDPGFPRYVVVSMHVADFDADGVVDIGLLLEDGYAVMWGKGGGAFTAGERVWQTAGREARAAVTPNEQGAVLYLTQAGETEILVVSLKYKKFQLQHTVRGVGGDWIGACKEGVLTGPDREGVVYVVAGGKQRVWLRGVPLGSELTILDAEGDGDVDALVRDGAGNRSGIYRNDGPTEGSVLWLPDSQQFSWLNVYPSKQGPLVLGTGPDRAPAAYAWSGTAVGASVPMPFRGDELMWHRVDVLPWNGDDVLLFGHNMVTLSAYGALVSDDVMGPLRSLFERELPRDVVSRDMDGDGDLDLAMIDYESGDVLVLPWLGNGAQGLSRDVAVVWGKAGAPIAPADVLPKEAHASWTFDVPPVAGERTEFVQVPEALFAEHAGDWFEHVAARTAVPLPPEVREWPGDRGALCLKADGIITQFALETPCLAEVVPGEWIHVVYTRDRDLRTTVSINGKTIFNGRSADVAYFHNMVHFGAIFGLTWVNYFRGIIDEVRISNGIRSEEEIQRAAVAGGVDRDAQTVGLWRFEGSAPFNEEITGAVMNLHGPPRLVPTPWGKGIEFNGAQYGYTFFDIPEREVTLEFRMLPRAASLNKRATATAVAMYGMHNLSLGVSNDPILQEGARSPAEVNRTPVEAGRGGHVFGWDGRPAFVLADGRILRKLAGTWTEEAVNGDPPSGEVTAGPWVANGELHALFGRRWAVWHPERGWEDRGRVNDVLEDCTEAIGTSSQVVFVNPQTGKGWWLDTEEERLYALPESPFDGEHVVGLVASSGQLEVVLANGIRQPLELHKERGAAGVPFVLPWWTSRWSWAGGGAVLAVAGYVLLRRRQSAGEEPSEHQGDGVPAYVARSLNPLAPWAGKELDTLQLDSAWKLDGLFTDETRRSRRSRQIKEINAWSLEVWGAEAIERTQDVDDRRRTLYRIHPRVAECAASVSGNLAQNPEEGVGTDGMPT
ncbi:MAG: LamG-like jellyroll fold domain-containing protein [Flavobacteriales bacterium]